MATKTYQTQLEEVQAAITAILTNAQSVEINNRKYSYATLEKLEAMETRLRRAVERETRGGIRMRGATPV